MERFLQGSGTYSQRKWVRFHSVDFVSKWLAKTKKTPKLGTSPDFLGFLWAANVSFELPEVISRGSCTQNKKRQIYSSAHSVSALVSVQLFVHPCTLVSELTGRILCSTPSTLHFSFPSFLLTDFSFFISSLSLPQLFVSSLKFILTTHIEP